MSPQVNRSPSGAIEINHDPEDEISYVDLHADSISPDRDWLEQKLAELGLEMLQDHECPPDELSDGWVRVWCAEVV